MDKFRKVISESISKPTCEEVEVLKNIMYESAKEEGIDEDDILYLGCLNIPITTYDVITERKLGKINMGRKLQSVIVELYLKEGWQVPHLHVYNDKFKTAIRLDKAEYFNHGKYDGKFNNEQAKIFNDFMKEHDKYINVTRWEIAAGMFNTEFSDHPIKISEQPDYSKLNEK